MKTREKAMTDPSDRPILVVEDDVVIQWGIETALKSAGYTAVLTASSRREARLAIARRRPHLAILDVKLESTTSVPLADKLAAARVPIVFLSAYSPMFLPERHRARPFISKPYCPTELVQRVDAALAQPRFPTARSG